MVAEEMQAVSKGLEKVEQELTASENDGAISMGFREVSSICDGSFSNTVLYFCHSCMRWLICPQHLVV